MRRYSNHSGDGGIFALFGSYLGIITAMLVGWILNLVQIINMARVGGLGGIGEWGLEIWLKIVGLFVAPLGAIMGWIGAFS